MWGPGATYEAVPANSNMTIETMPITIVRMRVTKTLLLLLDQKLRVFLIPIPDHQRQRIRCRITGADAGFIRSPNAIPINPNIAGIRITR
jgi:hypothetical protein